MSREPSRVLGHLRTAFSDKYRELRKWIEECTTGSVIFVIYIYDKNSSNECMAKSGTKGRVASWNSGRLPGGLVSTDMKSRKQLHAVLYFCCRLVGWLRNDGGVCMRIWGHTFVTSRLSSPLIIFTLVHSVLHTEC